MRKCDDFPLEARITVDYRNRRIDFEHLMEKQGRFWVATNLVAPTLASLSMMLLMIFTPAFFLGILVLVLQGVNPIMVVFVMMSIVSAMIYLPWVVAVPLCFSTHFVSQVFPRIGALSHILGSGENDVLVAGLDKPEWVLPMFSNGYLNYETSGEYSKFLERIEVREHEFHYMRVKKPKFNRAVQWTARFVFSETPRKGYMRVRFV